MDERELRGWIARVKDGTVTRRQFTRAMVGLGLTAPMAAQMLASSGVRVAQAQTKSGFTPTKRGGGGELKTLWWQAVSILNCHLAVGVKDNDGSRIFNEPLAAFDPDGNLVPILAAEVPTLDNGGVAKDGMSVTWKLKKSVQWHDGKPFTADDVVFTWEFAADPATAATTAGNYKDIVRIDKVDSHTVKIGFKNPTPFWAISFCGPTGLVIPKHVFEPFKGAKSREAPANMKPVGTGPYRYVDFKPNDVVRGELNPNYHAANWPFFDRIEVKGGGDATSAARAVIQTGEYDFGYNIQVEDDVLLRLEKGGKGKAIYAVGGDTEFIALNFTDPNTEVDGERSSMKTKHPLFSDPAVRKALALLVDREAVKKVIYGRAGRTTANFLNGPEKFVSKNTSWEFSIEKASKMLDDAGWKPGADGIREKDGKKLKLLYQTSINGPRQKTQAIVKQACQKAGIDVELKSVVASVFFSSDAGNPDIYPKFYADMEMFQIPMSQPDPSQHMRRYMSANVATKENKWQGQNFPRYVNKEYDDAILAAEGEMDPVKRAAFYIKANDILIADTVFIPVQHRLKVEAAANNLVCVISGWANETDNLFDWYREA